MADPDDPKDDAEGADDEALPTFKRDPGALLSRQEREIADRSATEASNRPKSDPLMPDDAQRGVPVRLT